MTDKNNDVTEVFDPVRTPLAKEHSRRAARRSKSRKKNVSKATRYTVSVLAVLLIFFLAFMIGSFIIKLIFSGNPTTEEKPEDSTSILQMRLDELTAKCSALEEDIKELQGQLDRYNELYGPLDSQGNTDPQAQSPETSEAFIDTPEDTYSAVEEL